MVIKNKKKLLSWINFIVSTAIFLFAISVFIISLTARSNNRQAELFGYSFAVVVTDSMSPEIKVGDLIIVKSCDITEIKEGQNAVFIGLNGYYEGKSIVHKVIKIHRDYIDETGKQTDICLETRGINNPYNDEDFVYAENFVGREIFHSTFLGTIMVFLRDPLNWIYVLIFLLAIGFATKQGVKIYRMMKAKKERKNAEIDAPPETPIEAQIETSVETSDETPTKTQTETQNDIEKKEE